jgi:hypothetical protein
MSPVNCLVERTCSPEFYSRLPVVYFNCELHPKPGEKAVT